MVAFLTATVPITALYIFKPVTLAHEAAARLDAGKR